MASKLILGPLTADEAGAAANPARKAVCLLSLLQRLSGAAGNGVFIMGYTPAQSVDRIVDYARGRGMSKFAALVPSGIYGERTGNALLAAVRAHGERSSRCRIMTAPQLRSPPRSRNSARQQIYDAVLIADGGRLRYGAAPLLRKTA